MYVLACMRTYVPIYTRTFTCRHMQVRMYVSTYLHTPLSNLICLNMWLLLTWNYQTEY